MSSFLDNSAGYLINMTALLLKRELSTAIKNENIDVTPEQWAVLNRLNEHKGLTQKEVAQLTFKDNANITRMVDKLEGKGLVKRQSDLKDRRSWKLSITKKGISIRDRVEPLAGNILNKISKGITKQEMKSYNEISKKIINNLTE